MQPPLSLYLSRTKHAARPSSHFCSSVDDASAKEVVRDMGTEEAQDEENGVDNRSGRETKTNWKFHWPTWAV
jgi:limonene-1,2-epoxide hydrolase